MAFDRIDVPDRVPEDLLVRYGPDARRTVRFRHSVRYLALRRAQRAAASLCDGAVWATAAAVFMWTLMGMGVLGGLVYGLVLWPWAGLYVLLPLLALVGGSLAVALRITRRRRIGARNERGRDVG